MLPTSGLDHSDFTIAAAQEIAAAKQRIDAAYAAQAKGKHATACEMVDEAILCFETASSKLKAHANYVRTRMELMK